MEEIPQSEGDSSFFVLTPVLCGAVRLADLHVSATGARPGLNLPAVLFPLSLAARKDDFRIGQWGDADDVPLLWLGCEGVDVVWLWLWLWCCCGVVVVLLMVLVWLSRGGWDG